MQGRALPIRQVIPLLAWIGVLAAIIGVFDTMGDGALAAPALTEPENWQAWAAQRAPLEVVFALGRLGVLAAAWYLLAVTSAGAAARLLRARRLVAVTDVLALPSMRRLLEATVGVSLVAATVTGLSIPGWSETNDIAIADTPTEADDDHAIMHRLDDEQRRSRPRPTGAAQFPRRLPIDDPRMLPDGPARLAEPVTTRKTPAPPPEAPRRVAGGAAATRPANRATEPAEPRTWRVERGDHLWVIAEQVLTSAWSDNPGDGQVAAYWRRLIDVNQDRLADPGNADLIYPGQVFLLPSVPDQPD